MTTNRKPCSTCPGGNPADVLVKSAQFLIQAHNSMASLYGAMAAKAVSDKDKVAFKAAQDKHLKMAEMCGDVTLPDEESNEAKAVQANPPVAP